MSDHLKGKTVIQIYFLAVTQRKPRTFEEEIVVKYAFPNLQVDKENINIDEFMEKIYLIKDEHKQLQDVTRVRYITESWHPTNFIKVVIDDWTIFK